LFLLLFLVHGALWLTIRTEGDLQERARKTVAVLWPLLVVVAVVFLVYSWFATPLYDNYLASPILFVIPAVAVVALLIVRIMLAKAAYFKAWFATALTIAACTFFGIIGLFPNLFPSSMDPAYSLTAYNASSSPLTLKIMLIVVAIFVPIVLIYQVWAYTLFTDKITDPDMQYEEAY
jgi:cytochrome d ubiquinol oxidase subunit II